MDKEFNVKFGIKVLIIIVSCTFFTVFFHYVPIFKVIIDFTGVNAVVVAPLSVIIADCVADCYSAHVYKKNKQNNNEWNEESQQEYNVQIKKTIIATLGTLSVFFVILAIATFVLSK